MESEQRKGDPESKKARLGGTKVAKQLTTPLTIYPTLSN